MQWILIALEFVTGKVLPPLENFVVSFLDSVVFAAAAGFSILAYVAKKTYDLIHEDHLRICARFPLHTHDVEEPLPYKPDKPAFMGDAFHSKVAPSWDEIDNAAQGLLAPAAYEAPATPANPFAESDPFGTQQTPANPSAPAPRPLFDPPAAPQAAVDSHTAPPSSAVPSGESAVGGRFKDGTLDIVGSFSMVSAANYVPLILVNAIFSYFCACNLLFLLFFLFRWSVTRLYIVGVLIVTPLTVVAWRQINLLALSLCVVKGNNILAERALMIIDVLSTFTIGLVIGIGTAIGRFFMGICILILRLLVFQTPVAPGRLAVLDAAFGSYGASMKCRYSAVFEDEALRSAPQRSLLAQPGALVLSV